jgi:hypothetical protein
VWKAESGFADRSTEAVIRKRVSKRIAVGAKFSFAGFLFSNMLGLRRREGDASGNQGCSKKDRQNKMLR